MDSQLDTQYLQRTSIVYPVVIGGSVISK